MACNPGLFACLCITFCLRDKLIHEYFGVDLALVWDVVERELPTLRPQLEELSQRLADDASSEDQPAY